MITPDPLPPRFTYTQPVTVGASGAGVGALVVFIADWAGVPLTPEVGAIVGGLIVTATALLTSRGIKGIFSSLWRGEDA